MRLAAHMVVRDDAYYVDMGLRSILPHIEGIYIQDQGSTDGTCAVIRELMPEFPGKIVLEVKPTGLPRFDRRYNEIEFRNAALERTIEIYNPDFICKFDADELVTPLLFGQIANCNLQGINGICIAESRFISKTLMSANQEIYGHFIEGDWYYGGHIFFWRVSHGTKYAQNPAFSNSFHPILQPDPRPYIWLPGITHIHLHRTFGPKAFKFWNEGYADKGIAENPIDMVNPFNARTMASEWFNDKENLGTAIKVDFDWPDYVLKKWEAWGIWE